jgi:hypothetical protein
MPADKKKRLDVIECQGSILSYKLLLWWRATMKFLLKQYTRNLTNVIPINFLVTNNLPNVHSCLDMIFFWYWIFLIKGEEEFQNSAFVFWSFLLNLWDENSLWGLVMCFQQPFTMKAIYFNHFPFIIE